jgi:hypothetical protein
VKRVENVRDIESPPSDALIEAHIVSYEKAKQSGEDTVPLEQYRDSLRISVDLYEKYGKAEVDRDVGVSEAEFDARIAEGKQAAAEADRDQALRDRWIWGAVGMALGVSLGVAGVALASF